MIPDVSIKKIIAYVTVQLMSVPGSSAAPDLLTYVQSK